MRLRRTESTFCVLCVCYFVGAFFLPALSLRVGNNKREKGLLTEFLANRCISDLTQIHIYLSDLCIYL